MSALAGFLIDVDGVVHTGTGVVPGAVEAIAWLREQGYPFRFLTNTSRMSRRAVVQELVALGFSPAENDVVSTSVVAAGWLRERGLHRLHLLVSEETKEDFEGFESSVELAEAVVVGDMGRAWSFDVLNRGFRSLRAGARLVALQKGRAWQSAEGWVMDAGAFVAALEYAADCEAFVVGKPSRAYFETALSPLDLPRERVGMIGDDPTNDIVGGRDAGLKTILVRTGKYQGGPLEVEPNYVLESIGDLPGLLDRASE